MINIPPNILEYVKGVSRPLPKGFVYDVNGIIVSLGLPMSLRDGPPPRGVKKGTPMLCFWNSTKVMRRNKLVYCEGLAYSGKSKFVHMHAWNLDDDGDVVDVTWPDGLEYVGIPFAPEFVEKSLAGRTECGIIDNWKGHYPLLTGEYKPEEFLHPDFKDLILTGASS